MSSEAGTNRSLVRRRVAVLTSSRADLGPLGPVIQALDSERDVELVVIATGTHSSHVFGRTFDEIRVSDDSAIEVVDAEIYGGDPVALSEAYGKIAAGVSKVLSTYSIDMIVVLGDRWELLAAAGAALLHGVPIAHIHGGEVTEGAIDERIRHGITKLADLHLCATNDSAMRIRRLGEESWRIVVTGAPGLDRMAEVEGLLPSDYQTLIGSAPIRPFGVVVYHPPTVDRADIGRRTRAVLDACAKELGTVLALYPGADPGSDDVIAELELWADQHENVVLLRTLGARYLSVLKDADVLVGNSSSGIIESASLRVPVVNIGDRQQGRLAPKNVIHAEEDVLEIRRAIRVALAPDFRRELALLDNPYGDGKAAGRIVRAILEVPLEKLVRKPMVDPPTAQPPIEEMTISHGSTLREALAAIERGRCQIAIVADEDGKLVGTIVDGDVRRALLSGATLDSPITAHVTVVPVVAAPEDGRLEVLALMHRHGVTQIPVVDDYGRVQGLHVMQALVSDLVRSDLS